MKLAEIEKLNAERTQGDWVTNEQKLPNGDLMYEVNCDNDCEYHPLLEIQSNRTCRAAYHDEANASFLAAAPTITEQYIRARKFEVTEEFIEKLGAKFLEMPLKEANETIKCQKKTAQLMLEVMWEEIENA